MKKLLLLGIGCAISASAMAQTEKGTKYLGASIGGISYYKNKNNSNVSVDIFPAAGVFVTDNFLIGSGLTIGYGRNVTKGAFEHNVNRTLRYGISPFARYYFAGTNAHRFFGQLGAGVQWYQTRYKIENTSAGVNINQRETYHSINGQTALGYNYFLTPGAALEVVTAYNRYGNGNNKTTGGLNITAGFAVFLPSKLSTTSTGQ